MDFFKDGKLQFQGITFVSFIGVVTGYRPGSFSMSMDARELGGQILDDFARLILKGAVEVAYAGRQVREGRRTLSEIGILSFNDIHDKSEVESQEREKKREKKERRRKEKRRNEGREKEAKKKLVKFCI